MIKLRHQQPTVWESLFAEEVAELWEPWMRVVDELLEDEELVDAVYQAQGKRHPQSRLRGRQQTPAEVALRMLILKHVRNWSYETLEREVRANVVYRSFCRIGMEKVPDAKTLVRLGQAIGPETVRELGGLKRKIRNRMGSVTKKVIAIGLALRHKGTEGELKRKREYRQLLRLTRQILNDSRRVLQEVETLPAPRRRGVGGLGERLETVADQVRRVVKQTKARVFAGLTQFPDKLVSLFEPHTEIIRKGKSGKPNEFGKLVELQEAENQIITHYEVYEERPSDQHLLLPAVEAHRRKLGQVPGLVAADAGFYSRANEEGAEALGVRYVSIPNRNTRSEERRRREKQRWFKKGQKWRTGCEGRISVIKRRHGLARCRYHGLHGMRRWVGLGVIADNLINLGRYLAPQPA